MNKKFYYSFSEYVSDQYNEKVWKIPINAGFTCPNRDGNKGTGGCIYCNNQSFVTIESNNIKEQAKNKINKLKEQGINKYIIYFQSYSNTYGSLAEIKNKIEASLVDKGIVGIHISTRPDVIDENKLDYLKTLDEAYDVVIEYGLQSMHDKTLEYINRCHTLEDFEKSYYLTKDRGIKVCVHVIFGLPGETCAMMYETIKYLQKIKIDSIKFHHLQVIKGTFLEKLYASSNIIDLISEEMYINVLGNALALLNKDVIIARLVSDARQELLIAPDWPVNKNIFLAQLKQYMDQNNLYQGKFCI